MAPVIPKRTLEEIRFRNDIVELVGSYVKLKRAGASFKGLCPFHKEKTPSFHVNPQRQIYHCFGCGVGGDAYEFVRQYEGVDFMTAATMLAERAGVRLEFEAGAGQDYREKEMLYRLHQELARFYQRCLLQMRSAAGARAYLEQRELSGDIVDAFLIGFAPNRWDTALQWGAKNGFSPEQLESAGVVVRRTEPREGCYDRFRNRLMFPIRDEQKRVIGFSGRALEADAKAAKYVNSPETPVFRKSRVLYALDVARRPIVERREALICEGQIDVIRCHQAGFDYATAAQGTAFTDDQVRILRRYADSVVLVFDPDTAGQDAAIRTAVSFIDAGLAVRSAALPPGEDPDSFIRKEGAEAFGALLTGAASAVGFQVGVLSAREDVRTEVGAMRVAQAVMDTIRHSPHAVQRARMVEEAAGLLGLPVAAMQDDLRRLERTLARRTAGPAVAADERADGGDPPEEVALCEHLTRAAGCPGVIPLVTDYLQPAMLTGTRTRPLFEAALEAAVKDRDLQDVLRERDDPGGELQSFAAEIQMTPDKLSRGEVPREQAVRDIILRLWQRRLARERRRLEQELDRHGADAEPALRRRSAEIRNDANALKQWDTGAPVIELHLG